MSTKLATTTRVASKEYIHGEPEPIDILCGSKKRAFVGHPGSKRFFQIVAHHQQFYNQATNRSSKSKLIRQIAAKVQKDGARFLKMDRNRGRWYVVSERVICDKIGHTLRKHDPKSKAKRDRPRLDDECSVASSSKCESEDESGSIWEPEPFHLAPSCEQSVEDAAAIVDAISFAIKVSDENRRRVSLPPVVQSVDKVDRRDSWMDGLLDLTGLEDSRT